jgi:hypothetical protein
VQALLATFFTWGLSALGAAAVMSVAGALPYALAFAAGAMVFVCIENRWRRGSSLMIASRSRYLPTALLRLASLAFVVAGAACGRGPSSAGDADTRPEDGCSGATCDERCRACTGCPGRWIGGECTCRCLDGGEDGPEDGVGEGQADLQEADGPGDDGEDAGRCTYRATGETRAGASPGVVCRRLSVEGVERGLLRFGGDGDNIAVEGGPIPASLWLFDRSTNCWSAVPEARGGGGDAEVVAEVAIEGARVAFWATWRPSRTIQECELRLLDADTREMQILEANTSPDGEPYTMGCRMDSIAIEYPWVVWRDIRQVSDMYNPWDAMAKNIESGEWINLSTDPATGARLWGSVVNIDLCGGLAVFDAGWEDDPRHGHAETVGVNLVTGERRQITDAPGEQFDPTVTEDWVVWVDLREHLGSSMMACSADIYGFNRATGAEVPLVTEGDALHGPSVDGEGPWLVYSDQRWDENPNCDTDREQSVVAYHIPTATELRITDWPGYEWARVYRRADGSYGVLVDHEVSYSDAIYRLWDCDLPEPGGDGS